MKLNKKNIIFPITIIFVFYAVAVGLFLGTGMLFYLLNFMYIGTALSLCIFLSGVLPKNKFIAVRRLSQLLVGLYLFVFVGIILKENLQIEGFWFYLFSGIFAGATIHYFIAKIFGTIFFGRGWCGWSCWTAMVLDLFPWKKPKRKVNQKLSKIRYLHFIIVFIVVAAIYFFSDNGKQSYAEANSELYWLLAGNAVYYILGFILACALKDNRAFCKYVCPIPVFQKIGAKYSLLKIEINKDTCIDCKLCEKNCPMQVDLLKYKDSGKRILSTECILCLNCVNTCPKEAVKTSLKIDKQQ